MTALQLPCTIFQTRHRMNDYGARDMRYGDLSAQQLQHQYHLANVSAKVDPYRLKKRLPFTPSQYQFGNHYHSEEDISLQQCARILFDEFRSEARQFSFLGPYRKVIIEMINHMQHNNGAPFRHLLLDIAAKNKITEERVGGNTLKMIRTTLQENIDWTNQHYPQIRLNEFHKNISTRPLPKFDAMRDYINGMAISIHDIWAARITIKSLEINNEKYKATIHFELQDHFGLDDADLLKHRARRPSVLGIWFILQRYKMLGFKPFMTNMSATIDIRGYRHESS